MFRVYSVCVHIIRCQFIIYKLHVKYIENIIDNFKNKLVRKTKFLISLSEKKINIPHLLLTAFKKDLNAYSINFIVIRVPISRFLYQIHEIHT